MTNPYAPPGDDPENNAGKGQDGPSNVEPPQFGQRSDSWRPNPDPQGPGTQQAGAQAGETPWPVYGQGSAGNQGPYQQGPGPSGHGQHGPYQHPQFQQQGQPYGQQFPQSAPYMQRPAGQPAGPPPSRTGAIWTLVVGIVMMVLVAPATFVFTTLSGVGLGSITDGSLYTTNGGVVVVDETGVLGIAPATGNASGCTLTDQGGTVHTMVNEDGAGIFVARGVPSGEYTVECEGVGASDSLVLFTGDMVNNLVNTAFAALGWATLVGITGLVVTIIGIVWLVRRNRARREFFYGSAY